MMYSVLEFAKYGMTYFVAYPDTNGMDSKEALEKWEMKDIANRELTFVKDEKEAKELIRIWKTLKK